MNISELASLCDWIDVAVVKAGIPTRYQELLNILNANIQPNRPKQPFEAQVEALRQALSAVPEQQLTNEQLEVLGKLKIAPHIGTAGTQSLDDILVKHVIDVATAASKVQLIINDLNEGINRSVQIKTGLNGVVDTTAVPSNIILIRIAFEGDASINNISALKEWSSTWYDIGRGVAMVHNSAPEDIRVVGTTNGSIILELTAGYLIVRTIAQILQEGIKVAQRIIEALAQVQKLRALKIANDRAAQQLENDISEEKKTSVDSITDNVIKSVSGDLRKNGEAANALRASIRKLIEFLQKGGEVDCLVPESISPDQHADDQSQPTTDDLRELSRNFQNIRRLSSTIKYLDRPGEGETHDK